MVRSSVKRGVNRPQLLNFGDEVCPGWTEQKPTRILQVRLGFIESYTIRHWIRDRVAIARHEVRVNP